MIFNLIVYIFCNIINLLILYAFTHKFLEVRFCNKIYTGSLILSIALLKAYLNGFKIAPLNLVSSLLLYLIFESFLFKNLKNIIFIYIVFICITMLSEELSFIILEYTFSAQKDFYYLFGILITNLLLLSFTFLMVLFIKNSKNGYYKKTQIFLLALLPITTIVVVVGINFPIVLGQINNIILFIGIILLIVTNILLVFLFGNIAEKNKIEIEYLLLQEKIKKDEEFYTYLNEKEKELKAQRHDFMKHLRMLNIYLTEENISSAKNYITNLTAELKVESFYRTGIYALDTILNSYSDIIQKNKIEIDISSVEKLSLSFINDTDLCIIFGNIFENAIESCMKSNMPCIKIICRMINEFSVLIQIINSCDSISITDGRIQSTKSIIEHGFGLENVKKAVKKNKGTCTFYHKKETSKFYSIILFDHLSK